jgi:hypothetical protein
MCFSPTASFTVGSFLLLTGVGSLALIPIRAPAPTFLTRTQQAALATVAAIPLIFGLHQISEGMVWLDFENKVAVHCFAFTAYAFWPFYISLAFALVEWTRNETMASQHDDNHDPHHHWSHWPHNISVQSRRRLQVFHVVLAVSLDSAVLANMVPLDNDGVSDVNGRLQYEGWGIENQAATYAASVVYAYVVVVSMYVSSLPYSSFFGSLVLGSLGLTLVLWKNQFPSTWCFFAALLSCVVVKIIWSELQLTRREQEQQERGGRKSKPGSSCHEESPELQEQSPV